MNKLQIAELARAARDAAPLRPQALQEAWEAVFVGALKGAALAHFEKDEQYLMNRAERIADAAVKRIEARRRIVQRDIDERKPPPPLPTPPPVGPGRRLF